jgi:hypothetical protein
MRAVPFLDSSRFRLALVAAPALSLSKKRFDYNPFRFPDESRGPLCNLTRLCQVVAITWQAPGNGAMDPGFRRESGSGN